MSQEIVFIVDDDPLVHFVTKKILVDFVPTSNIFSFSNARQVFEFMTENASVAKNLPDLILLDIHMPFMDGIAFLEQYAGLKPKLAKDVLIYIISSSMNRSDIYRVKNDPNVSGFITKPLNRENLDALFNTK